MITDHHFTPDSFASKPGNYCCAGIGGGELCGKRRSEHRSFDLDFLRDDVVDLLDDFIQSRNFDFARKYISAQAKYTNALYDWEHGDD